MFGCQAFIGLFTLKVFLIRDGPHDMGLAVAIVMFHKYFGYIESDLGEIPSDLGCVTILGGYHLICWCC